MDKMRPYSQLSSIEKMESGYEKEFFNKLSKLKEDFDSFAVKIEQNNAETASENVDFAQLFSDFIIDFIDGGIMQELSREEILGLISNKIDEFKDYFHKKLKSRLWTEQEISDAWQQKQIEDVDNIAEELLELSRIVHRLQEVVKLLKLMYTSTITPN